MRFSFAGLAPLLLLTAATPALARQGAERENPPPVVVGYEEWQEHYPGGPNTLPYGMGDAAAVLDHARGMNAVVQAASAMSARGYVRREDTDAAVTRDGYSMAVLGFEKPGFDVETERQPTLIVITKAFEIPHVGWCPTVQVFAGMVWDSSGVMVCTTTPEDSAMFVFGTPEEAPPGETIGRETDGPFVTDEQLEYMYTAFDALRASRSPTDFYNFRTHVSSAMQGLWAGFASPLGNEVTYGACKGAIQGMMMPLGGFSWYAVGGRAALGALIGGYDAAVHYWATHPRTTGQ